MHPRVTRKSFGGVFLVGGTAQGVRVPQVVGAAQFGADSRGFGSSHRNSHFASLFKREWTRVPSNCVVDRMGMVSGGCPHHVALGVVPSGTDMKDRVAVGNFGGRCSGETDVNAMRDVSDPGRHADYSKGGVMASSSSQQASSSSPPSYGMESSSLSDNRTKVLPSGPSAKDGFPKLDGVTLEDALSSKFEALQLMTPPSTRIRWTTVSDGDSLIERRWSPDVTRSDSSCSRGPFCFEPLRVMSFNSLARSLVDNKYVDNNREVMSWSSRKYAILDVIRHAQADIICLQEIDEEEYEDFFLKEFKRLKYGSVYKKKKSPKLDGVCILYREDRFDVIFHKDVEFAVHDVTYDRLQVAVVMALVDKHSHRNDGVNSPVKDLYIVSNTHLLFNKNRGDIKFAQLCAMLSAIKEAETFCLNHLGDDASSQPKPAIIMCGDFNFTPQSLLYHFLSNGYVVLRNCNARRISGQYLMFDWTYKTEQANYTKSGITIGNFERDYISDIYGTGGGKNIEWVEPICKTPFIDLFTQMPDWIKRDKRLHDMISHYLEMLSEHRGEHNDNTSGETPENGVDKSIVFSEKDLFFCPFNFSSAYSMFDPGMKCSNEPAFTAFHGWQRGCVDYIWYTKEDLGVECIYELPPYGDVKAYGNLPNRGWPSSDHFSLISQFRRRAS